MFAAAGRAIENREEKERRRFEAEKEQIRVEYQKVLKAV